MSAQAPQPDSSQGLIARLAARLGPHGKSVLGGIVSVVVLAAVILGVSALSAPKSSRSINTQLSGESTNDPRYDEAVSALASGETSRAVTLLQEVVTEDPQNQDAARLLESTQNSNTNSTSDSDSNDDAGESSDQGSDAGGTTTKPTQPGATTDPAFHKPTSDLTALLPESADGYSLGATSAFEGDATLSGTPTLPDMLTTRSQWSVHYKPSEKDAAAFVSEVSKSLYPKNAKSLKIDGASAYFGTDGARFATVVYVRGRYVFEVVLTTLEGQPASLQTEATKAAVAFPDGF